MSEPLSDDARAVLAFIIDHPNHHEGEIASALAYERDRVVRAAKELLNRGLIIRHMRPEHYSPNAVSGPRVYYPA